MEAENTSQTLQGVRPPASQPSVTFTDVERYVKELARLQYGDDKYNVNLTIGFVASPTKRYRIFIPEIILTDIRLEEA